MIVIVNNQEVELIQNTVVSKLLEKMDVSQNGLAVAINSSIIRKNEWEQHLLHDNDKVTLIKATQGG